MPDVALFVIGILCGAILVLIVAAIKGGQK